MHELAIAQNVIAIIGAEAKKSGFTKVVSIKLAVGEVCGVVPQCLDELFPIASEGTVAEGAKLDCYGIPIAVRCSECSFEGRPERGACPRCGSESIKLISGREFFVDSIEVE